MVMNAFSIRLLSSFSESLFTMHCSTIQDQFSNLTLYHRCTSIHCIADRTARPSTWLVKTMTTRHRILEHYFRVAPMCDAAVRCYKKLATTFPQTNRGTLCLTQITVPRMTIESRYESPISSHQFKWEFPSWREMHRVVSWETTDSSRNLFKAALSVTISSDDERRMFLFTFSRSSPRWLNHLQHHQQLKQQQQRLSRIDSTFFPTKKTLSVMCERTASDRAFLRKFPPDDQAMDGSAQTQHIAVLDRHRVTLDTLQRDPTVEALREQLLAWRVESHRTIDEHHQRILDMINSYADQRRQKCEDLSGRLQRLIAQLQDRRTSNGDTSLETILQIESDLHSLERKFLRITCRPLIDRKSVV